MFTLVFILGCAVQSDVAPAHDPLALARTLTTPEIAVQVLVEEELTPLPGVNIFGAASVHVLLHREEILETFTVAEALSEQGWAVVLSRYSVGGTVCHRTDWFRELEGLWLRFYVSTYSIEEQLQFAEMKEWAKEAGEKVDRWTEGQPDCWWE